MSGEFELAQEQGKGSRIKEGQNHSRRSCGICIQEEKTKTASVFSKLEMRTNTGDHCPVLLGTKYTFKKD